MQSNLTLQQLRYITEVVECGSINAASQNLYVSQPALSTAIRDAEQRARDRDIQSQQSRHHPHSGRYRIRLCYARQVLEQVDLLELAPATSGTGNKAVQKLSISSQHYAFCVKAFVDLVEEYDQDADEFTLRETRTAEISSRTQTAIEVSWACFILSNFNKRVTSKALSDAGLEFVALFEAEPHVFVLASTIPLRKKHRSSPNSLKTTRAIRSSKARIVHSLFSEEPLSHLPHKKQIT